MVGVQHRFGVHTAHASVPCNAYDTLSQHSSGETRLWGAGTAVCSHGWLIAYFSTGAVFCCRPSFSAGGLTAHRSDASFMHGRCGGRRDLGSACRAGSSIPAAQTDSVHGWFVCGSASSSACSRCDKPCEPFMGRLTEHPVHDTL